MNSKFEHVDEHPNITDVERSEPSDGNFFILGKANKPSSLNTILTRLQFVLGRGRFDDDVLRKTSQLDLTKI